MYAPTFRDDKKDENGERYFELELDLNYLCENIELNKEISEENLSKEQKIAALKAKMKKIQPEETEEPAKPVKSSKRKLENTLKSLILCDRIKEVKTLENFVVSVIFQDGVEKEYDVKQLFSVFPQFQVFETESSLFKQVTVDVGGCGISWNDELDIAAEEVWDNGVEYALIDTVGFVSKLPHYLVESFKSTLEEINEAGDCRMCLVEIEGRRGYMPSCITKAEEGMVVKTNTPDLMDSRRLILDLILSNHDRKCLTCTRNQNCIFSIFGNISRFICSVPFKTS